MVDPLVGPNGTHRDDPVGYPAYGSQILVADVIGMCAVLAVSGLVDDEYASLVRLRRRVLPQHLHSASIHGLHIPGRLREEKLQPLRRSALGSHDRFHAGKRGKRLVAVSGQQQPLQVLPETPPLGKSTEETIESSRIIFQRPGSRWTKQTFAHLVTPPPPLKHGQLRLTNYRRDAQGPAGVTRLVDCKAPSRIGIRKQGPYFMPLFTEVRGRGVLRTSR